MKDTLALELLKGVAITKKKQKNKMATCKYCDKEFRLERTLSKHLCVKKQRYMEKDTIGSRIGFRVFEIFYQRTSSVKEVTFEMFINSPFYADFIKFARYTCDLKPISLEDYVVFLVKNAIPLTAWTKKEAYEAYVLEITRKESIERALERSIKYIYDWANDNNQNVKDFFRNVTTFEATYAISTGKISPWVVFVANTTDLLLERLSEEQAEMIKNILDSEFWRKKIIINQNDVEFLQNVLKEIEL